jgi:metallo-beta-lactamase family protein
MNLQFLGAAGTVTGSKTLVTASGRQLLVDCGLFQGYKNLRLLNWEALPFDPRQLDAVVLTHAHLDHSGALPLLVKQGYKGPIFATPSTIDVCNILLPDSARLQEEDAEYNNRHHRSKHKIAQPLYTVKDADLALRQLVPLPFEEQIEAAGLRVRLRPAGHIVGASSVELASAATTVLFSGDLGRSDDPIMQPPSPIARADYVVVESTYGDRLHDAQDPQAVLGEVIKRTAARGGIVLIPAFAVGRAQEVLYAIYRLKALGAIPNVPVYLNSPMAIDMTEVYQRYRREHRLSIEECTGMCQVAQMVSTVEDSRALVAQKWPAVVVSASGMATGGRVLHHLKALAPHPRNTIVFAGFQAGGTRGGRIVAGERSIRIFGEEVAVNAEVVSLAGMSAHADAQQIMQWLATAPKAPKAVYLNHGEPAAADALRERIEHEFGWPAVVPRFNQSVEIGS